MKLAVVNESLDPDTLLGLRFLFPPVALPVDDTGKLIILESGLPVDIHYVALVFIEDTKALGLLEFGFQTMQALEGYARRYDSLREVEILFSREYNGDLRMTVGKNGDLPSLDVIKESAEEINKTLAIKYMKRVGYQVHDYESPVAQENI